MQPYAPEPATVLFPGETDWKLLVVDVDAADAPAWRDVDDIPVARVNEVREWYRMYKTAEGKGENEYGLDGRAVDAAHALRVAQHTHTFWAQMMAKAAKGTPGGGAARSKGT